jgi:hypothetical protein
MDVMSAMTPMESRSSTVWASEGYFDDVTTGVEPDFVVAEDEGAVDDEEVSRLAKQKGFGLGGIVDRLVGFSLFNVDEDGEESDEEHADETVEDAAKRKLAQLRRRQEQLAKAASSSAIATARTETEAIRPPVQGDDGGWQDAAWLLSVASKVLY